MVTHPKGLGRVCPEEMEQESRKCIKECPGGAPNPSAGAGTGEVNEGKGDQENDSAAVDITEIPEKHCQLMQEVWTECSVDCLQERYLEDACEKEAEVCLAVDGSRMFFLCRSGV